MWFLVGTATPLCLIGVLITQFRTRAPGAETFPQLMLARFGKRVHLLFCFITILNNLSILTSVVNTGSGFYSVISERVTFELAWIITVIVGEICASVGSMSDILPFSATIFVYLLTMGLVITIKVFFYDETGLLGKKTYNDCSRSIEKVYNATHAVDLSNEKDGDDHLTMRSYFSLEMGLCKFLARPTVEIAKRLLGPNGLFALFSLYAFIVTTATIMQIFSVTKILTLDIYAVHLRPFRVCYEVNCCIFCGKSKDEKTRPKDKCLCCDPANCQQCQEDLKSVATENINLPLSGWS
ncbi:urea active transporter-like protein [Echinococcus granulosus]|uniref:Urea active transporter-like protein n=1 Tax=Echinococcus granulosus TaxID=6210 RepID=W6V8D4_ECHGR|nr:urea active transporter-like protein [Echinococcus granulosus]EUB62779.1 urea active transporter-like protein [Echinococcus granulosus]